MHQEFNGLHLGKFVSLSNPHISKTTNFIFSQNSPPTNQVMPWCKDNLAMCKALRTQNFRAPRISWSSFGEICKPFQPSHQKNHEISFFHKTPHQATCAVVHRQPWPCAKPAELKTFVHQEFNGLHLRTFVGLSNHHISKITNFIFSQNTPPSHLVMSWCNANLGHVQNPPNSKLSFTKNLMVFIWGHF